MSFRSLGHFSLKKLLPLSSLLAVGMLLLFACSSDSTSSPVACGIRMQAQIKLTNDFGVSQIHNLGGVSTSGSMLSIVGNSACTGSGTTFSGTTAFGTGLNDNFAVRMNANWTVAWGYQNTAFSSCGVNSGQGFVPDAGAVFNNVCSL